MGLALVVAARWQERATIIDSSRKSVDLPSVLGAEVIVSSLGNSTRSGVAGLRVSNSYYLPQ